MVYPKEHYMTPEKMSSIIFINKQLATDSWFQVDFGSSDITAVQGQTVVGRILIINTYNDIVHKANIDCILKTMWARERAKAGGDSVGMEHIIWLGDFNRHHPMWDEGCNAHLFTRAKLYKAQHLIDVIMELELYMTLPKDLMMLRAM